MADKKDPKNPAETSYLYDEMVPRWGRANALLGGTEAMRDAAEAFLPQHAQETRENYEDRLHSNILFNVYELTLDSLTGKPFSQPMKMDESTPSEILEIQDDIDLQGNSMSVVAREWFREALAKSWAHLIVDFPRVPDEDKVGRTREDDLREKRRPYWRVYSPEDVIFMASEVVDGVERLTHVRIREYAIEQNGYAEIYHQQIRVLEPGLVLVYRLKKSKKKKEEWVLEDEYETGIDYIPMVTFYTNRSGKPPMDDLAHLNIRHWQSMSDQINILTVARFPMLAASGISEKMVNELEIGPRQLLVTREPNGRYYYVEHKGQSIEAGAKELVSLEDHMAAYGSQFLKKQPGRPIATGRALDTAEATSRLQDFVMRFEDAMQSAMAMTARWFDIDEGGRVDLFKDFSLTDTQSAELDALGEARRRGDISQRMYLEELKRRGVLAPDFDIAGNLVGLSSELPFGFPGFQGWSPNKAAEAGSEEDDDGDGGDD